MRSSSATASIRWRSRTCRWAASPGRRAGLEHRPDGGARGRLARTRSGGDNRPAVRLLDAGNFNAAAAVWSGQVDVVVSAGVESMSRVPMGSSGGDLSEKLLERWEIVPQGISAELIAERVGPLARGAGRVLVRVAPARAGRDRRRPVRERGRADRGLEPARAAWFSAWTRRRGRDTSPEALAALKPAFVADGKVTAGNSSQIWTARPPCSSRARAHARGWGWSRGRGSFRSASSGSTRG